LPQSSAPIPGVITTNSSGVGSKGTASSESLVEDASVASVAPIDLCSASSRKRGGCLGRNKAKNGAKNEKLDEKKKAFLGKKEAAMDIWISQVKEQTAASNKQVATGAEL